MKKEGGYAIERSGNTPEMKEIAQEMKNYMSGEVGQELTGKLSLQGFPKRTKLQGGIDFGWDLEMLPRNEDISFKPSDRTFSLKLAISALE